MDLPLPKDDVDSETGKAKRHTDSRLQTRLTLEVLQRRLFDFHNEARTITEEQGVNILYLAIGFLKWIDRSNNNAERVALLLLVPVDLIRQSVSDRFAIKWREEDFQDNLSLAEKLSIEFGVSLPLLNSDDSEGFDIDDYFNKVVHKILTVEAPMHVDELTTRMRAREEAAKEVSILLGFKALSGDFRATISTRIDHLVKQQVLQETNGKLFL